MLTKAQYRSMTRQYLDDPNAKRWSDSFIDIAIQLVMDDLWTDMLDQNPYLTSQLQVFNTLHTPGFVDLRLATNGGDLTQRFYRIQFVKGASTPGTQQARIYYPKDPRDYLLGSQDQSVIVATRYTYEIKGDQLWLYSSDLQFGPAPVEIRYSFKPPTFTSWADGSLIPWPEGGESAAVYMAAAHTMAKGNAEEAQQLLAIAAQARDRMLASIRRQYLGSTVPYTTENAHAFGGT